MERYKDQKETTKFFVENDEEIVQSICKKNIIDRSRDETKAQC